MVDIYNEIDFIKDILSNGISSKWYRDAKLLARYYKSQGMKKNQIKEKLKEKLNQGASKGLFGYSDNINFKEVNKILNEACKDKTPIRQITQIEVAKEVIDWFLNLQDTYELSDEEIEIINKHNRKYKKNKKDPRKIITWDQVKYLWTLYVWCKIQQQYTDGNGISFSKGSMGSRFKHDADLSPGFSISNNEHLLCDLGFIYEYLSYKNKKNKDRRMIAIKYIEKYPDVFNTPITDDNRVVIKANGLGEGDLYHPGYWLQKQKMGSFVCENCGKEFAYDRIGKNAHKQKYCKECGKLIHDSKLTKSPENKIIYCIDCGKEVKINKQDGKTCRCSDCQEEYRRKSDKIRKKLKNSADVNAFTDISQTQ